MITIKKIVKYIAAGCAVTGLMFAGISQIPGDKTNTKSIHKAYEQPVNSELLNVIRVVDGDTIIVEINLKEEKVRLIGVDTPETVKPGTPVQKYGKQASAFIRRVLKDKKVKLEFDVQHRDKYARLLAYVYLEDGRMMNKILLEEGYAQVMTVPPNVKYQKEFIDLERKAKKAKKGLWNSP